MPDIFWDGVLPLKQMIFGQPDEEKLVLKHNGDATFLRFNQFNICCQYLIQLIEALRNLKTILAHLEK